MPSDALCGETLVARTGARHAIRPRRIDDLPCDCGQKEGEPRSRNGCMPRSGDMQPLIEARAMPWVHGMALG